MFLWETDDNPEKPTERKKKGKGETIRRCRGRTTFQKDQSPSCWKLITVHSWLQLYNEGQSSRTSVLSVFNKMFLRFEPVVEPVSWMMESRRNLEADLLDFLICSRKVKKRFTRTTLMCVVLLNGSIKYLCDSLGMSSISLTATFHVFSIMMASRQKRSQRHDPLKWVL